MAIRLGFVMTTVLPSIQASLPESDVTTATGTFAFLCSFGFVWGITIPAIIFNAQVDALKGRITDEALRSILARGGAYEYTSRGLIKSLPDDVRAQVLSVYTDALKAVWEAAIAFSLLGFVAVFIAKDVKLQTKLETEFGLDEGKKKENVGEKMVEKSSGGSKAANGRIKPSGETNELKKQLSGYE